MNEFLEQYQDDQNNSSTLTSQESEIVFGVETASFNSNTLRWQVENYETISNSTEEQQITGSIWVLHPESIIGCNSCTTNYDACINEIERVGVISSLFENYYRINSEVFFPNKTKVLSYVSDSISEPRFETYVDQKNEKLHIKIKK